jgi:hypothetical protein
MQNRKISVELDEVLRSLPPGGAQDVPIVVTVTGRPDASRLTAAGMRGVRVFENIPAAAGRASERGVEALARLDEVVRIDFDGETRAM